MNVYFKIFLVLGCLGPIAVSGAMLTWLPLRVKTISQLCVDVHGFSGLCSNIQSPDICAYVYCAREEGDIYKKQLVTGLTPNGYKCGPSQVCQDWQCVDKPPGHFPTFTGQTQTFPCIE